MLQYSKKFRYFFIFLLTDKQPGKDDYERRNNIIFPPCVLPQD